MEYWVDLGHPLRQLKFYSCIFNDSGHLKGTNIGWAQLIAIDVVGWGGGEVLGGKPDLLSYAIRGGASSFVGLMGHGGLSLLKLCLNPLVDCAHMDLEFLYGYSF